MTVSILVDIFEDGSSLPVVTHVFNGEDLKEAEHYLSSHKKTDEFLRAALDFGKFKGMKLKVKRRKIEHSK